jgi:hypothetical protein
VITGSKQLIVTEWKFFRIKYLDVRGPSNKTPNVLAKAAILCDYTLSEILGLRFVIGDQHHQGMIKEWVPANAGKQLSDYIKSDEVTQRVSKQGLKMRAHLVIIVGSRHILLWDMDEDGSLANEPRLVGMTSTWKR